MVLKLTDAETVPIMLAAGLKPLEPYRGALKPWLCQHECGLAVRPRYHDIQQGQGGCPVCAGNKVDLEIVMAAMAAAELTPREHYRGANVPWLCRHECGREVRPRYNDIQQGQGGCKFCAQHWYDPNKPGCVYLVELDNHPDFPHGVLKIGMAGGQFQRLEYWRRRGWTLLEVTHCDDGKIPPGVEKEVLAWFREDLGLEPCLSAAELGTRGYTETVSVADLSQAGVTVDDVCKKVKQLIKKSGG